MSRNGECLLQRLVLEHVQADECLRIFDIGANQGEWTAFLLEAATPERRTPEQLRIDAFEPVPGTAAMFRERVEPLAGSDCVRLHELAMSSERGEAQIALYAEGAGTNTLHFEQDGRSRQAQINVTRETLADFCNAQGVSHIHLAKCDTEGHDLHVLQGARPLLESGRIDILQFEYNHRWVFSRKFLKDVFDLIVGIEYTLVRVDPECFPVFDDWHPELDRFFQSNYALIHDRALAWLPLRNGDFDRTNAWS